jgi:anti-sigma factor RsiW
MHSVVKERLEEYLAGALAPAVQRPIEAHLDACHDCRVEVNRMQEVRQLFSSLRSREKVAPPPDFYIRVLQRVGSRERATGFASMFSLSMAFGRRLVFASLLTLAVLGSYLVSRETDYNPGPSIETIMAGDHSSPPPDDRDRMLVTLTAYEP